MFIKTSKSGYTKHGEQFAHGYFLMLFQDPNGDTTTYSDTNSGTERPVPELRALIRFVKMSQLGQWMMARIQVKGINLSLSGAYGSDGLPMRLKPDEIHLWNYLHIIPKNLQNEFWNGGGHNSAGNEAINFKTWAEQNFNTLKSLVKR